MRRTGILALFAALTTVLFALGAGPASAETIPPPAVCVDLPAVLGQQTCAQVTTVLDADEQATTDEIAVLVVDSTDGESIDSYAQQAFNTWGVGQEGVNNGVLLVVALQDHTLRIQVGDGLTAELSDGQASEIVDGTVVPQFKLEEYRTGILQGLDAIRTALGHPLTTSLAAIPVDPGYAAPYIAAAVPAYSPPTYDYSSSSQSSSSSAGSGWWLVLVLVLVFIGIYQAIKGGGGNGSSGLGSGGYRSSSWSSGRSSSSGSSHHSSSSSHSSGGFGGGRSSGGGASGKW